LSLNPYCYCSKTDAVEITVTSNVYLPVAVLEHGFELSERSGKRRRRLVLSHSLSSTGVGFQMQNTTSEVQ